jgi:NitT/TauT family transport system permease protein
MRNALPVLTVLCGIVAIWYVAAVWMNATFAYDQAGREGQEIDFYELLSMTMAQERPVMPAPHQVAAEVWKGVAGQKVTSKRSLVYHGLVTLESTAYGFILGLLLGVGLAVGIVYFRVMEMAVMPWAIISQTIPIVALAPMIIVLSNAVGIEAREVPKAVISAYLSYFPVLVGMVTGLRSPDAMQVDLMRTWNASGRQEFWRLRLPSSLPFLFASLKVAVAAALVGAIVGELPTGAIEGLGARMLIGSQFGEPLIMWAALFAAALLAGGLILVVGTVERWLRRRMGMAG